MRHIDGRDERWLWSSSESDEDGLRPLVLPLLEELAFVSTAQGSFGRVAKPLRELNRKREGGLLASRISWRCLRGQLVGEKAPMVSSVSLPRESMGRARGAVALEGATVCIRCGL